MLWLFHPFFKRLQKGKNSETRQRPTGREFLAKKAAPSRSTSSVAAEARIWRWRSGGNAGIFSQKCMGVFWIWQNHPNFRYKYDNVTWYRKPKTLPFLNVDEIRQGYRSRHPRPKLLDLDKRHVLWFLQCTVRNGFLESVRGQGESSLLAGKGTGDWLLVTSPCRENSLQISTKKMLQTPCFESHVASKKHTWPVKMIRADFASRTTGVDVATRAHTHTHTHTAFI